MLWPAAIPTVAAAKAGRRPARVGVSARWTSQMLPDAPAQPTVTSTDVLERLSRASRGVAPR
jgi:hypothetical protein